MEIKKSTKLPEGVGKKIVEALKKQTEPVMQPQIEEQSSFEEFINPADNYQEQSVAYSNNETQESFWNESQQQTYNEYNNQEQVYEEDFNLNYENNQASSESFDEYNSDNYQEKAYDETDFENYEFYETDREPQIEDKQETMMQERFYAQPAQPEDQIEFEEYVPQRQPRVENNYSTSQYEAPTQRERFSPAPAKQEGLNLELSTNVDVLMRLVSQLPAGVTRQTGAQIIRQTMEAMGVSMNKVLTEAQGVQDELGHSIRDNMNTIEEYRNNIRILEKEVQKFRKKSDELEDLISLFILSEKEMRK